MIVGDSGLSAKAGFVESWAFRASQAAGRLLPRAEAAEAWFREEYEPIADLLDELGIGGPGTEATRYLRIVKLRNLLMQERGWSDDVIEKLLEAMRTSPLLHERRVFAPPLKTAGQRTQRLAGPRDSARSGAVP